jgi:hypothetical protein
VAAPVEMIAGHGNASFPFPRQAGPGEPVGSTTSTVAGSAPENVSTGAAYAGMSGIKAGPAMHRLIMNSRFHRFLLRTNSLLFYHWLAYSKQPLYAQANWSRPIGLD